MAYKSGDARETVVEYLKRIDRDLDRVTHLSEGYLLLMQAKSQALTALAILDKG